MVKTEIEADFERFRTTGDPQALARVFDVTAQKLLLLAAHVTGDHALAEDMVQNTFLIAVQRAGQFGLGRPLLPWLSGILVQEARMELRRRRRRPDPSRLPGGVQLRPEDVLAADELGQLLIDAIESMPATYRQVLNLHLVHGLKSVEIAHALGLPPETVRTQLHRGLPMLRKILPAGLASSVMLLTSGSGLAAMRNVVLERGQQFVPAPVEIASGGTLAKKLIAAIFVSLVVAPIAYLVFGVSPEMNTAKLPITLAVPVPELHGEAIAADPVSDVREALASKLMMTNQWSLTGTVRDQESEPVPGARVRARITRGDVVQELDEAIADASGVYRIDLGSLRELSIIHRATAHVFAVASAPGYAPAAQAHATDFPWLAEDPQRVVLDLEVISGAWLRGRVLRSDLSPAIGPSIGVWLSYPDDEGESRPRRSVNYDSGTDQEGGFELAIVREGPAVLHARAKGYGPADLDLGLVSMSRDRDVADIVLEPLGGSALRGRFILGNGEPFASMPLYYYSDPGFTLQAQGRRPAHLQAATTDGDGWFRVEGLDSGDYVVRVPQPFGLSQEFQLCTSDPAGEHLIEGQLLTIRLADGEDHPVPGLQVSSKGWSAKDALSWEEQQEALLGNVSVWEEGVRGFYLIDHPSGSTRKLLPEGSLWLFTTHLQGAKPIAEFWQVENGVFCAELTLRLKIPESVGSVVFDIRDEIWGAVTDYMAIVEGPAGVPVAFFRGADRASHLLPEGRYRVRLDSGKQANQVWQNFPVTAQFDIAPGEINRVLLRVRRGGHIRLQLNAPSGIEASSWEGLSVCTDHPAQPGKANLFAVALGDDGSVGWGHDPSVGKPIVCARAFVPGHHILTISAHGYQEVQIPVLVTAGEVADVEVTMMRR